MPFVLLNKPNRVLCQFTDSDGDGHRTTLSAYVDTANVYPAGRLDYDSEGLVLLTDDGRLQARISSPKAKLPKTYVVQVEGAGDAEQVNALLAGVDIKGGRVAAFRARLLDEAPALWERTPPIRFRKNVPTSWLEVCLTEGRNRQVRRMTAAVSLPTLRLVRTAIGPFDVQGLAPGECRQMRNQDAWEALNAD